MVDEKDFFREATRKICGNPEIEKALWDCLVYLRNYLPADLIFLAVYNRGTGTAEVLVRADVHRGEFISLRVIFPRDAVQLIEEAILRGDHDVLVADHMGEHPMLSPYVALTKNPDAAMMAILSKPSWGAFGGIGIVNLEGRQYTEEHVRIFSCLDDPFGIAFVNYMRYREVLRLKDILADDNRYLQDELLRQAGEEVVGGNFGLKQVMDLARQVAPLSSPVLLLGETGTGKEVMATAIHNLSPRRNGPMVKVNCGAIPESLMDSELFGHEKGAFTGALTRKRGRFERAHGGTIFLDEIGELTPEAQVRLLRVIQEKTIERVGGTEEIPLDIRIIAATHRNLEAMMKEGKFREDLYFRIQVFPITIPPLRKRPGDIPALVQYFLTKEAREMAMAEIPTIAPGAIERLMAYSWPGNVRELQNVVERALILSKGQPLLFGELGSPETEAGYSAPGSNQDRGDLMDLDEVISNHIRKALDMAEGRIEGEQGAARLLHMNPSTLRSKMRRLNIPFGRKG